METHVSSTTADVPEPQEVIGSHGNVELVIVVEKIDEEQPQKADSNSQPLAQDSKTPSNQSTEKDGSSQNSPPKQPLQETEKKQAEPSKTVLPIIKIQHKQSIILSPNKSENRIQNRLPDSNNTIIVQSSPSKEATSQAGIDSTAVKENNKLMTEQLGRENEEDLTIIVAKESSNDSQAELDCDASEKEHNKSISRELKSLINSAKESKIISECTKLTSKTRKSRAPLDTSNTNLNVPGDADSEQVRCNSDNSHESNSSDKSEKTAKRSMRSQNPEFVNKVKQFLNSVTGKFQKAADSDASSASDEEMVGKSKENIADNTPCTPANSQPNLDQSASEAEEKSNKLRSDRYCWRCHWTIDMTEEDKTTQPPLKCTVCPRSFHFRCLTGVERNKIPSEKSWVCPGCLTVLHAESSESRSDAMKKTSVGTLGELLKFALQRMTEINGVEPFMQPVDRAVFPDYDKYVVHPMDLALMKQNIAEGLYGSTEAFLGDAHWILHNSIIFNTLQSKLTTAARALVRCCRAEMGEIEACPECYAAANSRRPTWFTDVCSTPHLLLWAKLKGFPYWPSKAMSVSQAGLVDVRFFGAHDRAWVPARDCFLFSKKDPNNFRTKRQDILDSVLEAEQHIRIITRKYGKFVYAPYRIQFEPFKLEEQLKLMIPSFEGTVKSPVRDKRPKTPTFMKKSRSRSKGSKDGLNLVDDGSDREASPLDVEKLDEDSQTEKNLFVATRKRRRSEPKDAGTPDSCSKEKNRRLDSNCKEPKLKRNSSQLIGSSKEKAGDDVAEPMDDALAASPGATPKPSKNTPKTIAEKRKRSASPLQNKTPNKMTNSDKDKMTSQEPKAGKQYAKNSRSKSLNREPIKIEPNGADTSTNKMNAATENNTPSKTSVVTNKIQLEEDKPSEKASEPVAATPSATNKTNVTESSTITRSNAKEKLNESSTSIKAIDNQNEKPNKNSENENKKDETTDATQKKAKEKSVETVTPNKDNTKENTTNAVSSNKTTEKEKTNETDPSNTKNASKENTTDNLTSSNIVEVTKKRASTGSKEVIVISKVVENKTGNKKVSGTVTILPEASSSKTKLSKDNIFKDDGTRVSLVTRKVTKVGSPGASGLPTISCVRSLSGAPAAPATTIAATTSAAATAGTAAPTVTTAAATTASPTASTTASTSSSAPITVEVDRDSSIFTPTSTDQVHNMKDALNKLQKLKTGVEPPQVGRVGVKAFARISPPEKPDNSSGVMVEIKAEPIDFDEAEAEQTTSEQAATSPSRPRSVAAGATLREVRISKVVAGPVAKKTAKAPDVRPRAKKTFPQPKKADDGRSELTSKNSMVYIPIQGTARAAPRAAAPLPAPPPPLPRASPVLATAVNVMGPPPPPPPPVPLPSVPSAVHTVPLISSVNGHWTFSLQPVMSVGAGDSTTPVVNGVLERVTPIPAVAVSPSLGTTTITAITPMLPPPPPPPPLPAPPAPPAPPVPSATSAPAPPAIPAGSATSAPSTPAKTTTTLADVVLGEPPRLQQRPTLQSPLSAGTPVGDVPAPSAAGPLTAKLNQNSVKLADFFRTLLEDSLEQLEEPEGQLAALRLQLEQERWKYEHEVTELRHTQELLLVELRSAMEKEKVRAVAEARRLAQQELDAAVRAAKGKQWCANCFQEAQYYCCWNTAYCDYPCQRAHWAQHYGSCTQQRAQKAAAPALTVGGKVRAPPDAAQKTRAAAD